MEEGGNDLGVVGFGIVVVCVDVKVVVWLSCWSSLPSVVLLLLSIWLLWVARSCELTVAAGTGGRKQKGAGKQEGGEPGGPARRDGRQAAEGYTAGESPGRKGGGRELRISHSLEPAAQRQRFEGRKLCSRQNLEQLKCRRNDGG